MSYILDQDQDVHFVSPELGSKVYAEVINRQQKSLLVRKELKTYIPVQYLCPGYDVKLHPPPLG